MAKELEIEFKNMLTKEEYEALYAEFSSVSNVAFSQTNVYLDTKKADLKTRKMGLRVRFHPEKIELTLKVPTDDPDTLLEITDLLSTSEAESVLKNGGFPNNSEVALYLTQIGIDCNDLNEMGQLTTNRLEVQLKKSILLVIDESLYYGYKDYELEMEVTNSLEGAHYFHQFLIKHGIPIRVANKKIARMLTYKNKKMA